jgi:CBS domain containing-hemolysin-like protein
MTNPFKAVNEKLQGQTDEMLSLILVILALLSFVVAWKGSPVLKAALITWWVIP